MKQLVIIGARGYGREVCHLAEDVISSGEVLAIKGFLDNQVHALDKIHGYPPILSSVEDYEPVPDDVFVCALGDVGERALYAKIILDKGGQFISLIHPTAVIRRNSQIGEGCLIHGHVTVSSEVSIGNFVSLQNHTVIGHDVRIKDWCHLSAFVFLGGNVFIDERVSLFTRATVLPKLTIGRSAIVGAGSIVIKNVEPETTVFGNPAKKVL